MSLELSGGRVISLSSALRNERNVLHSSRTARETPKIVDFLDSQHMTIEAACAMHLGLPRAQCTVQSKETWIHGRFNLCVIVRVQELGGITSRKIFRCPLPHKAGEQYQAGRTEEKFRVEIANYAYIEEHCPEIPIARLVGFGLANSQYTHQRHLPLYLRYIHRIWRLLRALFHRNHITRFVRRSSKVEVGMPYMILDYIEKDHGRMLSDTWKCKRPNSKHCENLYRGISQLMLHLAKIPQPRIGSFQFNNDCSIELASPPMLSANMILESEGVPRIWHTSPCCTGSFLSSLLDFRHEALRVQPNAANDAEDCRLQMSSMILLRTILPQLVDYKYKGPFLLQYTDLHPSNIFVDSEWHVTGIIDLESVCSLPPTMLQMPWWLSSDAIDAQDPNDNKQRGIRNDFIRTLEQEEDHLGRRDLSKIITEAWESRAYWALACLTTIDGLSGFVEDYLYPEFQFKLSLEEESQFTERLAHFWSTKSLDFVQRKEADSAQYVSDMHALASKSLAML